MGFLEKLNGIVWGVPTLLLIVGVGVYLSIQNGFPQITLFFSALREFIRKCKPGRTESGKSSYRALCTALAATVGTGNIAGVAGAITIGGPGAIFWMWVSAFLGMATKYAEATLAVHYRVADGAGGYTGGPMYMIRKGLHRRWHPLATIYCIFGIVAALGVGNATQVNAVIGGIRSAVCALGCSMSQYWNWVIGVALCALVGVVLLGGADKIGSLAEKIVPLAALFYILLALWLIVACRDNISGALWSIFSGAFDPKAVTGGAIGSFLLALRTGSARGVFTNEAGMGTASIAHAGAEVAHPCQQGLMGIMEVFVDTILICTLTALVILTSGIPIPYGLEYGPLVTIQAFTAVCGEWVSIPLAICLCAFAVATIFGWGFYGLRCAQFLFGLKAWRPFAYVQSAAVILGAVLGTGTVWMLAEIVNGLMAIPNLIALIGLSPVLHLLTSQYLLIQKNDPTA